MGKLQASGKPMVDGVYDITLPDGSLMQMYSDMTRDGGGWTLVVSSHTSDWKTKEMVRERNKDHPSMSKDYSILKYVDRIKDNYKIDDNEFQYRLEAQERGSYFPIFFKQEGIIERTIFFNKSIAPKGCCSFLLLVAFPVIISYLFLFIITMLVSF